ncbi:hypothetical protein [Pseudomonas capeferrum]|uniref:hypothetical protein n=1 Tax=Pseudomonas capeferrum TaxID=1495066 RepID=UPI0030DB9ED3
MACLFPRTAARVTSSNFVHLGTHTAVDGDIQAEETVDLWQRDLKIPPGHTAHQHDGNH